MIYHLSGFTSEGRTHGGRLRSQQVAEVASKLDPRSRSATVRETLEGASLIFRAGAIISSAVSLALDPIELNRWGRSFLSTEAAMRIAVRDSSAVLWEPRGGVQPRAKAISGLGGPVIALPQNIESLVTPFMVSDAKVGWNRFRGELEALQACAGVFVISREEQWLLESIGIAAEYFPYVPAESRRQWLSGVRSQRTACVQDSILVLGTQSNEPTRRGVSEILAALGGRTEAHRIVVVGVGSDEITGSATDGPGIHKVGFLSEEDLVKEMARAKVALVWQPSTSGWPTRLVELPECGIPVIANPGALRAQESFPGVVLARTPAEAVDLLQGPISIDEIGEVATEAGIELSKVRAMIADAELDLVR